MLFDAITALAHPPLSDKPITEHKDPRRKGERPDLVAKSIEPEVLPEAYGSTLGLIFYAGKTFPAEYHVDAFVAMRGW